MTVAKALSSTFDNAESLEAMIVNFKVSNTGITLTDNKKKYEILFKILLWYYKRNN
jgi:hypothetical protein